MEEILNRRENIVEEEESSNISGCRGRHEEGTGL